MDSNCHHMAVNNQTFIKLEKNVCKTYAPAIAGPRRAAIIQTKSLSLLVYEIPILVYEIFPENTCWGHLVHLGEKMTS